MEPARRADLFPEDPAKRADEGQSITLDALLAACRNELGEPSSTSLEAQALMDIEVATPKLRLVSGSSPSEILLRRVAKYITRRPEHVLEDDDRQARDRRRKAEIAAIDPATLPGSGEAHSTGVLYLRSSAPVTTELGLIKQRSPLDLRRLGLTTTENAKSQKYLIMEVTTSSARRKTRRAGRHSKAKADRGDSRATVRHHFWAPDLNIKGKPMGNAHGHRLSWASQASEDGFKYPRPKMSRGVLVGLEDWDPYEKLKGKKTAVHPRPKTKKLMA